MPIKRITQKFTLEEDLKFHLPEYNGEARYIYRKKTKQLLAEISHEGILHIYKGYSWDGCSPKFNILGVKVGVWDGYLDDNGEQILKEPSCVHDVLCQMFHGTEDYKFYTRKVIDEIFLDQMKQYKVNYFLRKVYFYFVRGYALFNGYV